MPSVFWRCWLGGRKGTQPVKIEWWGAGMDICLVRGADLHIAQLMPLPLAVSCSSKIQIGFSFLVPAHLGSPGQRDVKRMYVFLTCIMRIYPGSENDNGNKKQRRCYSKWKSLQLTNISRMRIFGDILSKCFACLGILSKTKLQCKTKRQLIWQIIQKTIYWPVDKSSIVGGP